jgi:BirA family biotin operon repressor/biotin-[acetyl-CoA-carboxylase] ligase
MVNKANNTKKKILTMLRENMSHQSGEYMSEKLGISRVAVWKHIKTLQEMGYAITGSASGYIFNDEKDYLYPWEFEKERDNYIIFKHLDSTMETAREKAEKGCPPFTTIIAGTQSAGKGSADRKWVSDEGGLYFTIILKPDLPSAYHHIYTLAAAAALRESVESLYSIRSSTKWPNDLLYNDKKIAGILTEGLIKGNRFNWLNVGIGINVNNHPGLENSSTIKNISGKSHDRKKLLTTFEDSYRKIIKENSPDEIIRLWKKNNHTLGKNVSLRSVSGRVLKGLAKDIDASGSLLISDREKNIQQALFGDVYQQ